MSDNDSVLLEDINHKFDAIMEGQEAMASVPGDIAQLKDDMTEVKSDIRVIKTVLSTHSSQLDNHEGRITALEQN